jgi:adhesin transport system outer membrane protein
LTAKVAVTEKLDQASAQQVSVVQGELGLRLVDIWAALLDAEANRQVTQRTLDVLTRYQDIMKRRVSAGLSSNVELRLLAVRVSRAQTDLADAKVSLQIAAQRMAQIVGAPVDSALPELLKPIAQERLAEWVRQQSWAAHANRLDQHPAVRKAELDAAAAADQLVVQKAERMPKLVLGYQRQLGDLPVTTRDRSAWTLGLNYTPGAGLASFTQSAADSARLQARLEAVDTIRQEKREQLLLDWSALQREFDRRASLEATISSASDVLASYERQYFGGLKSWLEVLNAVQELTQSELRLAQAGNATTLAYYRWRLRGGELPHQTNWMQ